MTREEIENKIEYRKQKLAYHVSQGNKAKADWNRGEIAKFEAMLLNQEVITEVSSVKLKPTKARVKKQPIVEPIKVEPVVFTDEEKIF